MLWQAGAKFDPDVWAVERRDAHHRRAEEDRRRAEEDQRRAEEDRRRAKEDRRRAKEDARRSRQDARMMMQLLEQQEESEAESPDPATANVRSSEVPGTTCIVQIVEHMEDAADIPPDEAQQLVA